MIGPCLSIIYIVVFGIKKLQNDSIDIFLDHGTNVVEDDFFLVWAMTGRNKSRTVRLLFRCAQIRWPKRLRPERLKADSTNLRWLKVKNICLRFENSGIYVHWKSKRIPRTIFLNWEIAFISALWIKFRFFFLFLRL